MLKNSVLDLLLAIALTFLNGRFGFVKSLLCFAKVDYSIVVK
jgi:hypothetical protein